MSASRLEYLFNCYVHQKCTVEQQEELMALIKDPVNKGKLEKLITDVMDGTGEEIQMPSEKADVILEYILQTEEGSDANTGLEFAKSKKINSWFKFGRKIAASILLVLAAAAFWMFYKPRNDEPLPRIADHDSALPDSKNILLTLSDGSTVVLDQIKNGNIVQGGADINKKDGMLIYKAPNSKDENSPVVFNTLSTPKGVQFQVELPDGTHVWLNAASSLRYPTAFKGKNREVILNGEAYFEVAKNKKQPFYVLTGSVQVKVLGTHFNVNAYGDEKTVKTSLLEGRVEIQSGANTNMLKPGQQAILNKKEDRLKIANVDMEEVMAWKEGLFQFEGSDLKTIMREISRWYNVEVVYVGQVPVRRFQGKISRSADLTEVLEILELSDIKISRKGNKVIVE